MSADGPLFSGTFATISYSDAKPARRDREDPSSFYYLDREKYLYGDGHFPTARRPERRELDLRKCPSYEELLKWQTTKHFQIGPAADTKVKRHLMLATIWTWRDVDRASESDLTFTDLVEYRLTLRDGAVPDATPGDRRLNSEDQTFLHETCKKALEEGRMKRVDMTKESISAWRAARTSSHCVQEASYE